jgi:hypothetical protein
MTEVVPRLAPFVDFLRRNPTIVVHGPEVGGRLAELVEMFGIDRSRLVAGLIRVRTAYVLPVTHCGQPGVRQIQMTAEIYRTYIGNMWRPLYDRVVLIQRTGNRRFAQPDVVERVVRAAAADLGLEFSPYSDNPSPSLNDTMRMFYSAVMATVIITSINISFHYTLHQ